MPEKSFKSEAGLEDDGKSEPEQFRKLFIGGLTYSTTDEMLRDFYAQWGEIVDCIVMRDPNTKRSRGFGFVTYSRAGMLNDAMENRPHVIDSKTVEPKRAIPRDMSQRSEANMSVRKLYVSGVREEHTETMFKDYFTQFGRIQEVEIMIDKATGKPRGFAFVTFDDYDAVDKCVLQRSHMIDGKRCDVKKGLSKEEISRAQQQEREKSERETRSRGTGTGRGGGGGRFGRSGGQWGNSGSAGYGGGSYGGYGGGSQGNWNQSGGGGWNQGASGWGPGGTWNQGYGGGSYGGYGQQGQQTYGQQGVMQGQAGWGQQAWGQQPQQSWAQQPSTQQGWGQQTGAAGWNQPPQGWQQQQPQPAVARAGWSGGGTQGSNMGWGGPGMKRGY